MTEPIRSLQNSFLRVDVLAQAGPRIAGVYPAGQPNLLAELKSPPLETAYGSFHFRGGHRLWHSPEALPRTYIPDNAGLQIQELSDGLRLMGPTEPGAGIAKTIELHLDPSAPRLLLRHELRNDTLWPISFSPWALTMMRLGGVGIFPQPVGNVDPSGLLPNRQLTIWPYTRIADPRLVLADDIILVAARPDLPALKIGYYNPHGWMAYYIDGILFKKSFDVHPGAGYPDGGCNTETYCNDQFLELETLGPLALVQPGETVFHTETWELLPLDGQTLLQPDVLRRVLAL